MPHTHSPDTVVHSSPASQRPHWPTESIQSEPSRAGARHTLCAARTRRPPQTGMARLTKMNTRRSSSTTPRRRPHARLLLCASSSRFLRLLVCVSSQDLVGDHRVARVHPRLVDDAHAVVAAIGQLQLQNVLDARDNLRWRVGRGGGEILCEEKSKHECVSCERARKKEERKQV